MSAGADHGGAAGPGGPPLAPTPLSPRLPAQSALIAAADIAGGEFCHLAETPLPSHHSLKGRLKGEEGAAE